MSKRIIKVFLTAALSIVLITTATVLISVNAGRTVPENEATLFDQYNIHRSNNLFCEIFDNNETVDTGWIYKYAYDSEQKVIAYRRLTGDDVEMYNPAELDGVLYLRKYAGREYAITNDELILYDCKTGASVEFADDAKLKDYCNKKEIALCPWYYPAGNCFSQEIRTPLTDDYSLKSWIYGYSSIMYGEKELLFGFITDVKINNNIITLRLRQPEQQFSAEQVEANSMLSPLNNKPKGLYKTGTLEYEKIYYDKIIIIDTVSGTISEEYATPHG